MCVTSNLLCVSVVGLNGGIQAAKDFEASKPLRVYHLTGQLGIATDTCWKTGKKIQRASYSHVYKPHIDKTLAAMQASHQRHMYTYVSLLVNSCLTLVNLLFTNIDLMILTCYSRSSGVYLQSQEAYDRAVQGLLRPDNEYFPIIYGMKCIHFERPYFTIGKFLFLNFFSTYDYCFIVPLPCRGRLFK